MGVQGQVYVGALGGDLCGAVSSGTSFAALPLGMAAAMLAGCDLRVHSRHRQGQARANEIVSSLMLNYLAIELCNYLVRTCLPKPQAGVLTTNDFPPRRCSRN